MPEAAVDPRQLGKILLIQTTAHAIPAGEALAAFICRGLSGLPGVRDVTVRIGEACRSQTWEGDAIRDGSLPAVAFQVLNVPISSLHQHYGSIVLECADLDAALPYEPFLGSLANTIALTIENQRHAQTLEQLNRELVHAKEGLESVVRERTAELVRSNEELARQIEERTRYARELRESEVKYRDLFENASEAILVLDLELHYLDANRKAVDIFGYTRDELLRRTFHDLDAEDPGKEIPTAGSGLFSRQQRTKSGRVLDVEISSSPVVINGTTRGYRHIVRDVTAQRGMERAVRQAQKVEAVGTLASGIAHDFNNILTAIICSAELARVQIGEQSSADSALQRIVDAGNRASDLVRQILVSSRPAGDERKPLLVQPIVKECLKLLQASLPRSIQIVDQVAADVPMVLGDAAQLHQVVMNLCTNAYQAMPDSGGVLTVSLRIAPRGSSSADPDLAVPDGDFVLLEVADTGCGIEPVLIDRIFDPYFTTKEKDRGTGLGLSVVRGIITSFGGHIRVSSTPGVGSVFRVYLPLLESAAVAAEVTSPPPSLIGGDERVWIVDDELPIASIERDMLESLGYAVRTFASGSDLVKALRGAPDECDLVISDVGMPKMDGAKVAQEVLRIRPGMPVILCTGFSATVTRADALALGVREYVMKPLDFERISTAVRSALDGAAARS